MSPSQQQQADTNSYSFSTQRWDTEQHFPVGTFPSLPLLSHAGILCHKYTERPLEPWKSLVKTVWNWVICQTFVILSERFQREEQSSQQDWQFSLRFVFNSVRGPLLILSCEDLSFNLNLLIVSVWNFLFSHQDKFSVLSRATATKTEDIQRRK